MNWTDLLNSPEVHGFIGGILTAIAAWIQRKLELKKINQKHAEDLDSLTSMYEARINEPK